MKLAIRAYVVTLILLTLVCAAAGQRRSAKDPRNTAPTVGGGGPVAGPTGLFTVYDGQTLRKGEWTISVAATNYDRDPGDVDITDVPLSFQVGLTDKLELFFSTIAYRGVDVHSPRNLSGFYLPNRQMFINGALQSAPAIILAPSGPGNGPFEGTAVFRPTGFQPFVNYPFNGGSSGSFGLQFPYFAGPQFGFPAGTNPTMGPAFGGGGSAAAYPGIGSPVGSILPGVVLQTVTLLDPAGEPVGEGPSVFTISPSYLPSMPFLNRDWGQSSFDDFVLGVKWRWTSNSSPVGVGLMPFYRWYPDKGSSLSGFNQMQRGAGTGARRGDIGLYVFGDARLARWANLSANAGYVHTSNPKDMAGFTMIDLPDELHAALGLDFPVSKHFQYIFEFRTLQYVGGRTPNAFERNPMDGLAGIRVFPRRWWGFGAAYRANLNQQDTGSFDEEIHNSVITLPCFVGGGGGTPQGGGCVPISITNTFQGLPPGFRASTSPSGYVAQVWFGRRQPRQEEIINQAANVDSVTLSDTDITLPCPPGQRSTSGQCNDERTISVATRATDPENDPLVYNYTVSGGRIIGTGANVQWDLSAAQPGTYTITTGVDDGCGICGRTNTQTITVRECPDCRPTCSCPTVGVDGPSGITQPGQSMTFTATVTGGEGLTYNWTVSAGTITSGQGTPSITVDTTGVPPGTNVTATVDVGGTDPECNCEHVRSETAGIAEVPGIIPGPEFGKLKPDEIKARVDELIIMMNSNPTAQVYVINYGTPAQIRQRRAELTKAFNFRNVDMSRITWVEGGNTMGGVYTKFSLVPPGATPPNP